MELVRPDVNFDFVGKAPICAVISLGLILISLALMVRPGFRWGIDFVGGTVIEVDVPGDPGDVDEGRVRAVLSRLDFPNAVIARLGSETGHSFRISVKASAEERRDLSVEIIDGLTEELGTSVVPQRI
jgi:preprotein translocase subunit SecF